MPAPFRSLVAARVDGDRDSLAVVPVGPLLVAACLPHVVRVQRVLTSRGETGALDVLGMGQRRVLQVLGVVETTRSTTGPPRRPISPQRRDHRPRPSPPERLPAAQNAAAGQQPAPPLRPVRRIGRIPGPARTSRTATPASYLHDSSCGSRCPRQANVAAVRAEPESHRRRARPAPRAHSRHAARPVLQRSGVGARTGTALRATASAPARS